MNKKKIIIIITLLVTLLLGFSLYFGINNYLKNKKIEENKNSAVLVAKNFSQAWYNYTKQTTNKYLASIKPYMTDSFYNATAYVNTSRPQDFEGQLPLVSTIISAEIQDYNDSQAVVVVKISSREGGSTEKEINTLVSLEKTNEGWLVSQEEILIK